MTCFNYKKLVNNGNSVKIILENESSHLSISNHSKSINPPRLAGHVEVSMKTPQSDIQDIKLRFVGGVVSRSKPKGPATDHAKEVFVGSDRLFDKTVTLSNQSHFDKGKHNFPFQLSLPSQLPPSMKSDHVLVEYLLVAVVGFQNGCCGMIPILQKDPLMDRCDIQVITTGLHESFERQIQKTLTEVNDPDNDENNMEMGIIEECLCVFPFDSAFMLQMSPIQSLYHDFPISIQKPLNTEIKKLSFSVWEKCTYKYHVEYHNHKVIDEEDIHEKLLAHGDINLSESQILPATDNENNVLLSLPVVDFPGWLDKASQDLHSKPAKIVHFIKLHLWLEKNNVESEFNLKMPIQLAESMPKENTETLGIYQEEKFENTMIEQYSQESMEGLIHRRSSR